MTGEQFPRLRAIARTRRRGPLGRKATATLSVATAALLAVGLAGPAGGVTASARPTPAKPLPVAAQRPVPVHPVPMNKISVPVVREQKLSPTSWPAAGTATAAVPAGATPGYAAAPGDLLAAPGPRASKAGTLPVWVGPALTAVQARPAPAVRVRVSVAAHAVASAAGIKGVVFAVGRSSGGTAGQRIHVSLSYSSFAEAYGGDYAARLRIVALPSCVLTTPGAAVCRKQTPVTFANNVKAARLGADVTLPASSSPLVLAASTSPSGSEGDFSATPLSEAGQWAQAGPSGGFSYAYPVKAPPVPGGLVPDVTLNYNSQAVDGLTSSTNNQASWVGDGWNYSPGYIERDFQSCQTKPPGATNWVKSGDLCWSANDVTTLSLNGTNTTLVQDSTTGKWRAESDGNEKISYQTGTTNTTHDGDYWVITEPDGKQYYFGYNQLPGYTSGDTATQSAWSAPVFSFNSADPCYNATSSLAYCNQAWRWNLDYVVDPHGNATAYFYTPENNYYARFNGTTGSSQYQQGGALTKIEYGLRAGAIYGVTPAGQVTFGSDTSRTDVPTDLTCASGASCLVVSPTFWTKHELTGITTYTLKGTALSEVDTWALSHTYPTNPDPNEPAPLWLSQIVHKGEDGTEIPLPPTVFSGRYLDNRVETSTDNNPTVARQRLIKITTETGGVISVGYDTPQGACTGTGSFPAEDSNSGLCYPSWWTPSSTLIESWFNKYVVTSITQQNTAGGGTAVVTTYCYGGTGTAGTAACLSGGAWHYADDTLTRSQNRTWDEWRGFREVTTETGTAPDPVTETQDTYFQGMDGDHQANGTTNSASLTAVGSGDKVTDSDQFSGMKFEHIINNGAGGSVISDTVTLPWTSAATATQSESQAGLPDLHAFMTGVAETKTFTPGLAAGGTRESDVTYTHDSDGRVTAESDVPDTSKPAEDTCTTTSYADNTSTWILDLPDEVQTVSVPCTTTPSLPANAVSDNLTFYDSATTLGAAPTAGNVTKTERATAYTGSTPTYAVESTATFDQYGRALTSTDADQRTTTTAYSPSAGAEPTSVTVTAARLSGAAALNTITTYDPARDLPLTVTNPANYVITETYDSLGRLTAVWKPGNPTTGPANEMFSYSISNTAPTIVTTQLINGSGNYMTDETMYDSLGRLLETQNETADGNRTISDVYYDSDGWKLLVSDPYYATGAPNSTLVAATDNTVPSQTGYVYDGDGRVLQAISYKLATETWETDTSYGGDYTTVIPPAGGTPKTTFTDGRGLTTAIWQYHAGITPSVTDPAADYDATTYTYWPSHKLDTITDAGKNAWSFGYDYSGNRTSQHDPDAGTTSSVYDPAGLLISTTDQRNDQVSLTYDAYGRKSAEYDTTNTPNETSSNELASWTYDSIKKGMLSSSSTFYGGLKYTKQVVGYNSYSLPTGNVTIIPQGVPLAGSYTQTYSYDQYSEQLAGYDDGADGGLVAEDVSIGYDAAGHADSLTSPAWTYVPTLSYTELGQPLEYTLGTSATPAWILNTYDEQTNRLSTSAMQTGLTPVTVDATAYTYDDVGNVLQEADTPSAGASQVQCFQYDYLGRLRTAWSQGSTGCTAGPSQSAESGAAGQYWNQYTYDVTGNLNKIISTPASGTATTTQSQFPTPGPSSQQPHAVQSQTITGPSPTLNPSYGYDVAGNLTSVTGAAAGNESLTWDDADRLAQVTANGSTTSYLYDANGNLLLQEDPATTTLYLPDEQVVQNNSSLAKSGTRFYTLGGVAVAARTSTGTLDYLDADQQQTATLAVDASSLAVTRRYFDPYGNPVGAAPSAWPGTRGFVGGTADPATNLVDLGAREYQPANGAFISPDPLLAPYNPQNLNAYGYASDNPSTYSDPSGARPTGPSSSGGGDPTAQSSDSACSGNISACELLYYQAHGGQVNTSGIPTGVGYVPGSSSDYCSATVCVNAITGIPNRPAVIPRPVVTEICMGLSPSSYMTIPPGSGFEQLINVPADQRPEILITPEGVWGPLIAINVPGNDGPSVNINVPGSQSPERLINVPGCQGPVINANSEGNPEANGEGNTEVGGGDELSEEEQRAADIEELAQRIAGHAAEEHFGLTPEEAAPIIQDAIENGVARGLNNDRTGYYNDGVVVIENPRVEYGGTAYYGSLDDFLKLR